MPTCRTVPMAAWDHVRTALTFYFSRRHRWERAEDLAHETITAILQRPDFEFEKESDFTRVCLGFARRISLYAWRQQRRDRTVSLDEVDPAFVHRPSLTPAELSVLLDEVLRAGAERIDEESWDLIEDQAGKDPDDDDDPMPGKTRTRLHRARKRLAILTGWRKK